MNSRAPRFRFRQRSSCRLCEPFPHVLFWRGPKLTADGPPCSPADSGSNKRHTTGTSWYCLHSSSALPSSCQRWSCSAFANCGNRRFVRPGGTFPLRGIQGGPAVSICFCCVCAWIISLPSMVHDVVGKRLRSKALSFFLLEETSTAYGVLGSIESSSSG